MFLSLERLYLELIRLLKGGSEFDKNDILKKVNCNVVQGIYEIGRCGATQLSEEQGLTVSQKSSPILPFSARAAQGLTKVPW